MSQQPGNVKAKVVGTIPLQAVSEDGADWPLIVWQGTQLRRGAWKVTWSKIHVLDHLPHPDPGMAKNMSLSGAAASKCPGRSLKQWKLL